MFVPGELLYNEDHSLIIHPQPVRIAALSYGDSYFSLVTIRGNGNIRIRLSLQQMIGNRYLKGVPS